MKLNDIEAKQMKECMTEIQTKVDNIEKLSLQLVSSEKELDPYDNAYKINQEAHKIKHILQTYTIIK
jgi:hypothetical protein